MSAGKIIARRRSEPGCDLQKDGTKIFGPENGTRLYFTPSGQCGYHWRSRDQVKHRKAATKGFSGVLNANGNPSVLVGALMQLSPGSETPHLEHEIILGHINRVLHSDSPKANRLMDELSSAIKAARRLNGIDSKDSEAENFLENVCKLGTEFGRPPTKGELSERFYNFDSSKVSKQAKATGLSWLPDSSRPRRRGNK
jgi:hypothetical protein